MTEVRSSEPRTGQLRVGRSDDVFFAAVRLSPVPMIVTDPRQPDHPIVFANHAFRAMTGYGADEIIGRNCRFLQGAETNPDTVRHLRDAIAARREFAAEILNYRKDGGSFWNALSLSPVFDGAGDITCFVGTQQDITRRREAEGAAPRTQKTDALAQLTGSMAHDFNNLLQVIVGYLELIKSGLAKPEANRERLTRSIENARTAADRATDLTQQLIACARSQRMTAAEAAQSQSENGAGPTRPTGADRP